MDGSESVRLAAVLARVGVQADPADAVRHPSASNPVFRVGGVVVRLPSRARVGVDRSHEVTNMRRASAVGVAPAVVAWDPDGTLVTELVGGRALRPIDGSRHLREVAAMFRTL